MKVAVLTAGRSGSMSLYHACCHIHNFSTGHDSKEGTLVAERAQLTDGRIEIDTRFAWMLGQLQERNGDDVHYVFLTRGTEAIANSYNRRWTNRKGIIRAFCEGILQRDKPKQDLEVALDLVQTVEANIRVFLASRPHSTIRLECWSQDLRLFFSTIGADVDFDAASESFAERHNASRKVSVFVQMRFRISRTVDSIERTLKRTRS